jgi:hypothetical protein
MLYWIYLIKTSLYKNVNFDFEINYQMFKHYSFDRIIRFFSQLSCLYLRHVMLIFYNDFLNIKNWV